ncbi:MAG: hypothetical protein ABSC15_24550, partial [Terriglobales bacterium]
MADQSADCELRFEQIYQNNVGEQSSVAMHSSGLVVNVFKGYAGSTDHRLLYRIGKLYGPSIAWGNVQETGANGYWPAVTISKEGYVII